MTPMNFTRGQRIRRALRLTKRRRFYFDCQYIADRLHEEVAELPLITEEEMEWAFGFQLYRAYLQEMRSMGVDMAASVSSPMVEWLHYSRYFLHKSRWESRDLVSYTVPVLALVVSIIALFKAS